MTHGIAAIGYLDRSSTAIPTLPAGQSAPLAANPAWGPDAVDVTGMPVSEAIDRVDEARILDLRQRIAAGTYLSDHKLDAVVDRLMEVLRQPVEAAAAR